MIIIKALFTGLTVRVLFIIVISVFIVGVPCDKGNTVNNNNNNNLIFGTMTNIDGNVYKTIKIGNQEWMAENLRTTRYNDGSSIPLVTDSASWGDLSTPAYCYYGNTTNADTIMKWRALYNWYVVSLANPKKIAPAGWRVPDTTDWNILQNYLIANGYNWDGTTTGNKIAKSLAAKTDWSPYSTAGAIGCDLTKNNSSGFSALPGGYRYSFDYFTLIGYLGR